MTADDVRAEAERIADEIAEAVKARSLPLLDKHAALANVRPTETQRLFFEMGVATGSSQTIAYLNEKGWLS